MRFPSNRVIKHSVNRSIDRTIESKNGVLWDHLPNQRICRVKIQGSDNLVVAYYPEGWHKVPYWLKTGAPVRIAHVGGIRGRIEVIGIGQTVPLLNVGDALPDPTAAPDQIMNGCTVTEIPNDPQMAVMVHTGTYRIDGVQYTLDPIKMTADSPYVLGMGGAMDDVAAIIEIDAAPSDGPFRYDLIVVGEDEVIDYIKGETSELDTEVPEGHIQLAKILIITGRTSITNSDIGREFTIRVPSRLVVTYVGVGREMEWGQIYSGFYATVLDQYGTVINSNPYTGLGWYMTLEFLSGNGYIAGASRYASWSDTNTFDNGDFYGGVSQCHFAYQRLNNGSDISPLLLLTLEIDYALTKKVDFLLYDDEGELMI